MLAQTLKYLVIYLLVSRVKVEPVPNPDWWKDGVYYRVLVDSFKDSDGDGIGDIKGLIGNMGYIKSLGAQAIILSPITLRSSDCTSPGLLSLDPGQVDPRFGSDQHFTALLDVMDKLELKLIATLDLKTTSFLSEWSTLSTNKSAGYEEYLVWNESKEETPPPAVVTEGGEVLWKWSDKRGSHFATDNLGRAVLNACSPSLRAAASAVLVSWLRREVFGILIKPDFLLQPDCGRALVKEISRASVEYSRSRSTQIPLLMVETNLPWRQAVQYYASEVRGLGPGGADMVLYKDLLTTLGDHKTVPDYKLTLDRWMTFIPPGMPAIWMSGSPSISRVSTVFGSAMTDAFNILNALLPGSTLCYQGDELGIPDAVLERGDPSKRCYLHEHSANSPFPWDNTANTGGFTSGTPWLPLADNYRYCNAKMQFSSNTSHAAIFRAAIQLKLTAANGADAEVKILGSGAVGVLRWGTLSGSVLALANVGDVAGEALISRFPGVPAEYTVVASSAGSALAAGDKVSSARPLRLSPGEAALFIGGPRHCGGPGPVEKIASKLSEAAQKFNKYFNF